MAAVSVGPVKAAERIGALDVLRGVAVCGILLMNIPLMGLPSEGPPLPDFPVRANLDWTAFSLQSVLFAGSMRGLFTLLFGAGMLIMLRHAEGDSAQPAAQAYLTRCFALMLLGIAQFAIFLWPGEILFNYGIVGLALFLFRRAQPRLLLTAAAALLAAMSIMLGAHGMKLAEGLRAGEAAVAAQAAGKRLTKEQTAALEKRAEMLKHFHPPADILAKERAQRTSFPGVLAWSTKIWVRYNVEEQVLEFLAESLAFMLIGMALFRANVLSGQKSLRFYALMALGGYGVGLAIRGAWHAVQWRVGFEPTAHLTSLGGFLYEAGRLPTTMGLLGLVLLLYKLGALGWVEGGLKAIGRLALTNYVGQSVITSVLFYGLGYYDRFGFAGLMGVTALIWVFQGVFSVLWLRRYEMGPAEWLLRSVTYGVLRPLGRVRPAAVPAPAPAE